MKTINILCCIALLFAALACNNQNTKIDKDIIHNPATASGSSHTKDLPKVTFDNPVFEFGKVIQGDLVEHTFIFTNTGNAPLLLSKISTDCGCTLPEEWPKEPIKPGEGGEVKVIFDTAMKNGIQNQTIRVLSNGYPSLVKLHFKGFVVAPSK